MMADLIDRQAAIDAIMADKIEGNALDIAIALGDGKQAETLNEACNRHAQLLNALPSVQSEVAKDINVPTNDCIRRQAAVDAIDEWGLLDGLSEGLAKEILSDESKVPSAQPEIIRCKDCKKNPHWEWVGCPMTGKGTRKPDDFCSYAERRTNGV